MMIRRYNSDSPADMAALQRQYDSISPEDFDPWTGRDEEEEEAEELRREAEEIEAIEREEARRRWTPFDQ